MPEAEELTGDTDERDGERTDTNMNNMAENSKPTGNIAKTGTENGKCDNGTDSKNKASGAGECRRGPDLQVVRLRHLAKIEK